MMDGRFFDEKLILWKMIFQHRLWHNFFLFRFADFQKGQAIRICVEELFSL
jgi:hypothetical protein